MDARVVLREWPPDENLSSFQDKDKHVLIGRVRFLLGPTVCPLLARTHCHLLSHAPNWGYYMAKGFFPALDIHEESPHRERPCMHSAIWRRDFKGS